MKKLTYSEWLEELEKLFKEWLFATDKSKQFYIQSQYEQLHKDHWFFSLLEKLNF